MSARALRTASYVIVLVALLALVVLLRHVLLLMFAALLIALILTSLTSLLRKVLPVGHKPAFAIVLLLLVGLIAGVGILLAPSITQQFSELADRIPRLVSELEEKVQRSPAFEKVQRFLPAAENLVPSGGAGRVTQVFSSTFQMISSFIFVSFTALFLAASPWVYRDMLVKLFPVEKREAARETIARATCALRFWLLGQSVSMTVVGLITGVALGIAGIPFATALGIIAGLAEFIPIAGPILAAIPALLLAMTEGTDKLLIVLGIVAGIQFLEGNIIMPLVQRKAIDLPPVVTLVSLVIFGEAFGLLGMFVATPLAAVILILVEDLYLQRYLKTDEKLLT